MLNTSGENSIIEAFRTNNEEQLNLITKSDLNRILSNETISRNFNPPVVFNFVKMAIDELSKLKGKDAKYEGLDDIKEIQEAFKFSSLNRQLKEVYEATILYKNIYVFIDINQDIPQDFKLRIIKNESDIIVYETTKTNKISAFGVKNDDIIDVYMMPYTKIAKSIYGDNIDTVQYLQLNAKISDSKNGFGYKIIEDYYSIPNVFPLISFGINYNTDSIFPKTNDYELISINRNFNFNYNMMQFSLNYDGFKTKIQSVVGKDSIGKARIKKNPDQISITTQGDIAGQYAEYNGNANIQEFERVLNLIQTIFSVITGLPKSTFSVDTTGAESGIAKLIENSPLWRKITTYREMINDSELMVVNSIINMYNYFKGTEMPECEGIDWGELDVTKDEKDIIEIYGSAVNNKLMSLKEAIQEYRKVSIDEATEIYNEIIEEDSQLNKSKSVMWQ